MCILSGCFRLWVSEYPTEIVLSGFLFSHRRKVGLSFFRERGRWQTFRLSMRAKSNWPSFKIRRGSCLEKLARRSSCNTTKTSVWASRHPRRPSRATTSTRNALLLVMSPSEGRFCLVTKTKMERTTLSSSQITCTTLESITALRRVTGTCLCTFPPVLGASRSGTLSQRATAGPQARWCPSTCTRSPRLPAPRSRSRSSDTGPPAHFSKQNSYFPSPEKKKERKKSR